MPQTCHGMQAATVSDGHSWSNAKPPPARMSSLLMPLARYRSCKVGLLSAIGHDLASWKSPLLGPSRGTTIFHPTSS